MKPVSYPGTLRTYDIDDNGRRDYERLYRIQCRAFRDVALKERGNFSATAFLPKNFQIHGSKYLRQRLYHEGDRQQNQTDNHDNAQRFRPF